MYGMRHVEKLRNKTAEYITPGLGALVVSSALLVSGGKVVEHAMKESGKVDGRDALEQPNVPPVSLRIGTWNMHSEAAHQVKNIRQLADEQMLHALLLQEVTRNDFSVVARNFKDWTVKFVMADRRQEPKAGGLGNVMMARTETITDIDSTVFEGDLFVASLVKTTKGAIKDLWAGDTSWHASREGLLEHRSAIAGTMEFGGQKYRIITSHIARQFGQAHPEQLEQLTDFIKDNTSEDYPTIFCGDLNSPPRQAINVFAQKLGYISTLTSATSTTNREVLDYCFSHDPVGQLIGKSTVNYDYQTDHHPVIWQRLE